MVMGVATGFSQPCGREREGNVRDGSDGRGSANGREGKPSKNKKKKKNRN
jgi:hypothetical protein